MQAGGQTVTIRMPGAPKPPVQPKPEPVKEEKPAEKPAEKPVETPKVGLIRQAPVEPPKADLQAQKPGLIRAAAPQQAQPQQTSPRPAQQQNAQRPRPQNAQNPHGGQNNNRPQQNGQRPASSQAQKPGLIRPANPNAQRPQQNGPIPGHSPNAQRPGLIRPANPNAQPARPAAQGQQGRPAPRPDSNTPKAPARPVSPAMPKPSQPRVAPRPMQPVANINVAMPGQAPVKKKQAQPQQQPARPARAVTAQLDENGEVRVDTRASHVELDKYNERYEQIAPGVSSRAIDNAQTKQKLTQKSQQRKPYNARRETEADKLKRLALEKARKQQLKITVPDEITVGELASRLKVTASEVIKKLMQLGIMANISQVIDYDTAELVATELGAKVEREVVVTIEQRLFDDTEDTDDNLVERSPIVVVMGHVDHGKTSLLDYIRKTKVAAGEAGGITQHIGAYRVDVNGKEVTFLDTPGHAAFTSMRARGAMVTDIAVLVVAADDGVMPQTVEAINHAKAAGVSIIVAINKIDKPGADVERVKQELMKYELVPEEWGGDIVCCPVSAVTGEGVDNLLEMITLVADVKELKANPDRLAKGTVIEARLDKGRGPVATILVQNGTLHTGDVIIAGTAVGHVRVMTDDHGRVVHEAGPSVPVEVTGLADVPSAGDEFNAVEDERLARELVEKRRNEQREEQFAAYTKVTLDNLFSQIAQGEMKELPIIVKADVQGSVEAVTQSLQKLSNDEVRVKVIHGAVGAVSESDVMLANASNAIIVGFNVRPDPVAAQNAQNMGVEIRLYRVIYDCIEEIEAAMKGMLAPKTREVDLGRVEVRMVYHISSVGNIAGSYVLSGKITRTAQIRVVRDGIIVAVDKIASLRRMKDDVREVQQGYECGIGLEKFNDIKEGDILEAFEVQEYRD